jgi:DNA-binding transcriptional ArsR family regulator
VKNITIALDDATYRRVRILAAERELSISALVKSLVSDFGSQETVGEQLKVRERQLRDRIRNFRASDKMSRDEVHGRSA